jgi:hypothetical protein
LLSLVHPDEVRVSADGTARAGDRIAASGECPFDGRAIVELVVRRDRLTFKHQARDDFGASSEPDDYRRTYVAANNTRLAAVQVPVSQGRFRTELVVPENARGACHVRVFVQGRGRFAAGAADVVVEGQP